jgi:hypothetical protein
MKKEVAGNSRGMHGEKALFRIRLLFAYTTEVASRTCTVPFQDASGMRHSLEVVASSLYEAAVLAIKEFRSCSFTEVSAGKGTRLYVAVRPPAESHEITVGQVESWLQSSGKSPREQATKIKLAEILCE